MKRIRYRKVVLGAILAALVSPLGAQTFQWHGGYLPNYEGYEHKALFIASDGNPVVVRTKADTALILKWDGSTWQEDTLWAGLGLQSPVSFFALKGDTLWGFVGEYGGNSVRVFWLVPGVARGEIEPFTAPQEAFGPFNYSFGTVDEEGRPTIALPLTGEGGSGDLLIARWNGTEWETSVAPHGYDMFLYPSLFASSRGLFVFDMDNCRAEESGWEPERVLGTGDPNSYYYSVNFNAEGEPVVGFEYLSWEGETRYVRGYAERDGGTWNVEALDESQRSFGPASAVRGEGFRYLVSRGPIHYYDLGSGWVRDSLELFPTGEPTLRLDPDGYLHLLLDNGFYATTNPNVKFSVEEEGTLPARLSVSGTLVRFSLPKAEPVRLVAYDAAGRLVKVLFEGSAREGEVSLEGLKPGIYVVALWTPGMTLTVKVVK